MNSIFKKIALRISLLFVVMMIAAGAISISHLDKTYKQNTQNSLLREAREIEQMMKTGADPHDFAYAVDDIMDVRITIMDLSGRVVLDTRADVETLDNHGERPEMVQALAEGTGTNVRRSDTLGTDLMYTAVYSQPLGVVIRTSRTLEGISALSAALWIPLVIVLAASLLLGLGIALLISRSITRPITQIKDETLRVSGGQYDYVHRLKTGDEIEALSDALADMVSALQKHIDEVSEKNSQLVAVFQAIPGGLIAVDNAENIIMANPSARKMFSISGPPEGRHFLEAVGHAKLEAVIRSAFGQDGVVQREVAVSRGMEEMVLQVFAVSVKSEGGAYGVILLAQDITHLKKLENMRSDFAANVSHELKTPLTVIGGFIDTLKEQPVSPDDAARFLDIISLESQRLTRLIDDVLALSDIENAMPTIRAAIDIRKGVSEAVSLLEDKASGKHVELLLRMPQEPVMALAENDRIKQMVINLVDNAVKYTPEGGQIRVELSAEDSRALLSVSDNGIGIPKDNLPRLFERFYRVDKSRSRALGGTGLGLAIVKHIVNLLGGHITVDSEVGKGTTFTVYLPLQTPGSQ